MKTFIQYLEESALSDKIKKFIDNISFEYRMSKDDDISDEDFKKVIVSHNFMMSQKEKKEKSRIVNTLLDTQ